jgi:hypothetical protein
MNKTITSEDIIKSNILALLGRGEGSAISNSEIRKCLARDGYELKDAQVRAIIKQMREEPTTDGIILASGNGYYLDDSPTKHDRLAEIAATRDAIQRQYLKKYQSVELFFNPTKLRAKLAELNFFHYGHGIFKHRLKPVLLLFKNNTLGLIKTIYDNAPYRLLEDEADLEQVVKQ